MMNFDLVKIQLERIFANILSYSNAESLNILIKNIRNGIDEKNIEVFTYCCTELVKWYSDNIDEIRRNRYVFNFDEHITGKGQLEEIVKDFALNYKEYKDTVFSNVSSTTISGNQSYSNNKVFIVHGRDNEAKIEVARYLERFGIDAIILHEQVRTGSTIIERIEQFSDVGFAVVLYTPCDLGKFKNDTDLKLRARQNVIFEHGYMIAKIGRNRVCALVKDATELPNDISGIVYTVFDPNGAWKIDLAHQLSTAGFSIDLNKIK